MIDIFQAVVLGIVEGLTEFIPVSSTGHMILVGHLMGSHGVQAATFEVFIQLGAILAVVFLYKDRFLGLLSLNKEADGLSGLNGILLLALTTLPALLFGALTHSYIKQHLFNPTTVALGLGIGGIIMLFIEHREKKKLPVPKKGVDLIGWKEALAVGFFQSLALWPGVSRSGATIVGGMILGIERKAAAEYSFLAAVPLMCAAVILDLYKAIPLLSASDILIFLVGFFISFVAALIAIRFFIRLLGQITLIPFAWYRIALAAFILLIVGRQ
ncbi:MAG: undecaprenyl-diphosphate phosphatase [Nitrospirota bacterium]